MYRFLLLLFLTIHHAVSAQTIIKHAIQVADSKVYVEESGKGSPLLLLHAGNMDHRMWDGQVAVFSKRFRVINCDLRGCGLTQDGDSTYLQSDALLAVMDSLHIRKASLAGVSLGSVAATAFALAHPQRVDKLVLVSPGLIGIDLDHDSVLVNYSRQMEEAEKRNDLMMYTEWFVRAWVDGPARKPGEPDSAFRKKAYQIVYENKTKRKPGVHLGFEYEPTQLQQLPRLHTPILVITGKKDMKDIRMIAGAYRKNGAKLVVLPSAAHMVNMEQPDAFNRAVLKFL